eukprot:2394020-Pyramimonas_sp.AAC.1
MQGAQLHPSDEAVRARAHSLCHDRLVRKVFRWLGAAMQEGDAELTAEDGHDRPGMAAVRCGGHGCKLRW